MAKDDGTLSAENAAALIKVTPRHLARLAAEGWIKRNKEGRYTVVGTVHGRCDHYEHLLAKASQAAAKNDAVTARAKEINLRIAQKERQLIDIDEAVEAVDEVIGVMRSELDGLPARLTRERELRHRLEEAFDGILKRASARLKEKASDLREGQPPADAVAEDDA